MSISTTLTIRGNFVRCSAQPMDATWRSLCICIRTWTEQDNVLVRKPSELVIVIVLLGGLIVFRRNLFLQLAGKSELEVNAEIDIGGILADLVAS